MKLLIGIFSIIFAFLLFTTPVLADDPTELICDANSPDTAVCAGRSGPTVNNPINVVIANVIQVIILVAGFAAVIVIMVSGFRYITSSGNPETTNSAKNGILFAIIGLVIAMVAQVIVSFVLRQL